MMVAVLLERDCIEAQIQKRYMEKGQYDLCIDEGTQVTELTSHGWSRIEQGMTIVMRIIFEQRKRATPQYQCHICKIWNELISGSVDLRLTHCSIDCRGCNRRFQISLIELYRKAKEGAIDGMTSEPSKIDTNQTTETEMWLIRNFHVRRLRRRSIRLTSTSFIRGSNQPKCHVTIQLVVAMTSLLISVKFATFADPMICSCIALGMAASECLRKKV